MGRYMNALQNPVIIGVLLGLLSLYDGCNVLAATGGRMGGSFFSSEDEDSSVDSSSSSSYHDTHYVPYDSTRGSGAENVDNSYANLLTILGAISVVVCLVLKISVKKTSVIKLQVGLTGKARSLQRDLNRIAEAADTSSPKGLSYILQETTLALLRNPDYCISAYSWVDVKSSIGEVEKLFNKLSLEERGKLDEETLVNANNIRKQSATTQRSNNHFHNEYIVITIIVAAGGVYNLPPIHNSAKLKEALQKLATIPSNKVKAMEVLWTPQSENDSLTEPEYYKNYSLLYPL